MRVKPLLSQLLERTRSGLFAPSPTIGERLDIHLRKLFELLAINCVLDVGANEGQFGTFLRQLGFDGNIISFEPSPSQFNVLKEHADRDARWTAYGYALGDEDAVLDINVTSDSLFSSFLQPNEFILKQGLQVKEVAGVPVKRLDSAFDDLLENVVTPRVYLKMDTQGYDLKVLAGALGVLASIAALQSEVSVKPVYEGAPHFLDALAEMNRMGFELTGLFPVARDNALRVVEFDCVMIRAGLVGDTSSLHPP